MFGKDIVKAIKPEFPGFDHALYSKVLRPDRYGIMLVPKAEAIRASLVEAPAEPHKREHRSKANKYTWRAGNALNARLQTAKKAKGILTDQEAITIAVLEWIERSESK